MSLHIIAADTTSKLIEVMIRDSSTGQGKTGILYSAVSCYYIRSGAAAGVAVTMVAADAIGTYKNQGAAGSGGGWIAVDATNQPGLYQFSVPDAVLASGVTKATISWKISGAIDHRTEIIIADKHRGVGAPDALPAVAAGGASGLPVLDSSLRVASNMQSLNGAKTDGTIDADARPTLYLRHLNVGGKNRG